MNPQRASTGASLRMRVPVQTGIGTSVQQSVLQAFEERPDTSLLGGEAIVRQLGGLAQSDDQRNGLGATVTAVFLVPPDQERTESHAPTHVEGAHAQQVQFTCPKGGRDFREEQFPGAL